MAPPPHIIMMNTLPFFAAPTAIAHSFTGKLCSFVRLSSSYTILKVQDPRPIDHKRLCDVSTFEQNVRTLPQAAACKCKSTFMIE